MNEYFEILKNNPFFIFVLAVLIVIFSFKALNRKNYSGSVSFKKESFQLATTNEIKSIEKYVLEIGKAEKFKKLFGVVKRIFGENITWGHIYWCLENLDKENGEISKLNNFGQSRVD